MNVLNAIADVLAQLLLILKGVTGSYLAAIVLLTVAVKVVLHPLTRKQLNSMRAMQALAPQVAALREKYRDDPKTMNTEMMGLYRAHGVNPLGGCLPLLLQMPVLYGLFTMFRRAGIFGHATALGIALDRLPCTEGVFAGACWARMIQEPVLLLIIALVGATTYFQQRMTTTDPQQARLFILFPFMFAVFAVGFPVGLSIYWIVYSLVGMLEYYLVMRLPSAPPPPPPVILSQRPKGSKNK